MFRRNRRASAGVVRAAVGWRCLSALFELEVRDGALPVACSRPSDLGGWVGVGVDVVRDSHRGGTLEVSRERVDWKVINDFQDSLILVRTVQHAFSSIPFHRHFPATQANPTTVRPHINLTYTMNGSTSNGCRRRSSSMSALPVFGRQRWCRFRQ